MSVVDTENFQKDVIEKSYSIPVLVDFWAEWCGPCRILGPILERLADKYSDRFELVKLNTDHFQEIAGKYGIRGIPNVKLFSEGKVTGEFTGALPEPQVEDWIKKNIPGKNEKVLAAAAEMIYAGKEGDALKLLNELKSKEPENKEIDILLARVLLFRNPEEALSLVSGAADSSNNIELMTSIGTIASLLEREKRNDFPDGDAREEYIQAVKLLKGKDFDSSLEKFIDIIRNNRGYDDDGARKACIAIFKYLGEENPVTLKHRRDFGGALYV